jgi:O-antigen/teichoic acid export membrane protein
VLSSFARLGADNVILRFVSVHSNKNEWNEVQSVFKYIVTRVLIFSGLIGIIVIIFSGEIAHNIFKKQEIQTPLIWMALSVPLLSCYTVIAYGLQGIKKIIPSVSLQNISIPVLLIGIILILSPKFSIQLSEFYFISSILTLFIGFYWWKKNTKGEAKGKYNYSILKQSARPLWTVAILQQCIQWSGQFISGMFVDSKSLAQLAVAQRTSMLISFILIAVNLVSASKFASLYSQNKMIELKKYAINTTRLMTLIALPIVILVCMFPSFIMSAFGKGFTDKAGVWILCILSLGQFVNVITGSVQYLLMMSGHERDIRNITIINGIFALLLAIILTPFYGAVGAAVATSVAIASQNLMAVGMVKKRLGFNTLAIW